MPKRAEPLNAKAIDSLPIGWHADGGNLYLQVSPTGKSWVFRYMIAGKRRDMGLGPYPLRTLAAARQAAIDAKRKVLDGIDPIDERLKKKGIEAKARIKRVDFETAAKTYIQAQRPGWRNRKSAASWEGTLRDYVYPVIGRLPLTAIGVEEVLACLRPIWTTKPETASRVRGRVEAVLSAAEATGIIDKNPARWQTLRHMLPAKSKLKAVKHHAAAGIDEIADVLAQIRAIDSVGARCLAFTILTACRTGEAIRAKWPEFDLAARVWTVPAERMKSGREHRVALSDAAMAILNEMKVVADDSGFVFPGARAGRPLSDMALLMTLRRIGRSDLTTHGMRSTFADWVAERTEFPAEIREMALAHAVGDKVEAAYRRGDMLERRRKLSEAWAKHCGC